MVFSSNVQTLSIQELVSSSVYNEQEYGNVPKDPKSSFDPADRVTLSWRNVNVYVKPQRRRFFCKKNYINDRKQLLHGVSGEAKAGQLLAIMGSSGAGKTTLMNVLTSRNLRMLDIEGDVLVNGHIAGDSISRMSAYIQQEDLFIGTLTVKEHLIFQSLVRMEEGYSYKDRLRRVEEVIVELGLSKCADTMIGAESKCISGGQAKRLAFASEVLTNPALMFCDEPTSGLDSFMAQSVVQVLQDMAKGGRTIVCTIHQPSSETFELFDHLMLLAEGRVAYRGEAVKALEFFEKAGLRCPINYNPADFYVHNLAIIPGKETESKQKVAGICSLFSRENSDLESFNVSPRQSFTGVGKSSHSRYKCSWWVQFKAVLWRSWISMSRDLMTTKVRFAQAVGLGLLLGLVFFNQTVDEKGIQNINGFLMILLLNVSFSNMMAVINVFMFEQPIFLREHWNGMYRTDVYFLSKTLAEAPIIIGSTMIHVAITYWMVGLNSGYQCFLMSLVINILLANVSASYGYMVSCMSSSMNMALSLSVPMLMPIVLFGGFFLNVASIPIYLEWVTYISFFFYANEATMINQWWDISNITCTSHRCPESGKEILDALEFKEGNFIRDILLVGVLMLIFRLLAFLGLLKKSCRET